MKLPPAVAGVTLLSFAGGAPDLFTQLAAVCTGQTHPPVANGLLFPLHDVQPHCVTAVVPHVTCASGLLAYRCDSSL